MVLSATGDQLQERHVVVSIDDEPCVLAALRRALRNEPYELLTTQAPEEAIAWVLEKHASLFLVDQRMPQVTGLELLELAMKCSPSTVRVMLTGQSDLSGVLKLKSIEAIERLIRKPWDVEGLKRTLREVLCRKKHGGNEVSDQSND
jgi:two-component system, repressor protein LuxO